MSAKVSTRILQALCVLMAIGMVFEGRASGANEPIDLPDLVVSFPQGTTVVEGRPIEAKVERSNSPNSPMAVDLSYSLDGGNQVSGPSSVTIGANDSEVVFSITTSYLSAVEGLQEVRVLAEDASTTRTHDPGFDDFDIDDNLPPSAITQSVNVDEDDSVAITLTGTDPDSNPLNYSVVSGPGSGSLTGTAPNLTYSPNPDYHGSDSFEFLVNDQIVDSSPATVSITVNSIDDVPTAENDSYSVDEDSTLMVQDSNGVLINDSVGGDGGTLEALLQTGPSTGSLSLDVLGGFTYTPSSNFAGQVTFSYLIKDQDEDSSAATVTITVNQINDQPDPPVLDSTDIAENSAPGSEVGQLSTPDPDNSVSPSAGQNHTYTLLTMGVPFRIDPGEDILRVNGALDAEGTASYAIDIKSEDNGSPPLSNQQNFVINVNDVNEAATDITFTPGGDMPSVDENLAGEVVGTLGVDDPDNPDDTQKYTFLPDTPPDDNIDNGFFVIAGNQVKTKSGFDFENLPAGSNAFSIKARDADDPNLFVAEAFTVTINDVPESPVPTWPTSVSHPENVTLVQALPATDPDGDSLDWNIESGGHGTQFVVLQSGTEMQLHFITAPDFEAGTGSGQNSKEYTVNVSVDDNVLPAVVRPVVVTVQDVPEDPFFTQTSYPQNENAVGPISLMADDGDDGQSNQSLTFSLGSMTPEHDKSKFNVDANNELVFLTEPDFENPTQSGPTANEYKVWVVVTDDTGRTAESLLTVNVNDVPEPPTIEDIVSFTIPANTQSTRPGVVITSDPDTPRGSLTFSATSSNTALIPINNVAVSTFVAGQNQDLIVTPVNGQSGTSDVVLSVTDGVNPVGTATFTITVTPPNNPPTANDDSFTVTQGASGVLLDVLANDTTAPDTGETLSILSHAASGSQGGTISQSGSQLSYTSPSPTFLGSETFTYTASDGNGGQDSATVSITVDPPPNQPPTLTSTAFSVDEETIELMPLTGTDPENTPLDFDLVLDPNDLRDGNAFVIMGKSGDQLQFKTPQDFEIPSQVGATDNLYEVEVRVSDAGGAVDERWVSVTVLDTPENVPPTISTISDQSYHANERFLFPGAIVVDDPDGSPSLLEVFAHSSNPSVVSTHNLRVIGHDAVRDLEIVPVTNNSGSTTITVSVSDGVDSVQTAFIYTVIPSGIQLADTDGDGCPDYLEDTDGDGVPTLADESSFEHGDTDGDGLEDCDEKALGLDPRDPDSNDDGFRDGIASGNQDPTAVDDVASVGQGTTALLDVLSNDSTAPDIGETLIITAVGPSSGSGQVTISADRTTLNYTAPTTGGQESFTYTINDGRGGVATATVTITITTSNQLPTISGLPPSIEIPANVSPGHLDLVVDDPDGPESAVTIRVSSNNIDLLANDNLSLTGTDADRILTLAPRYGRFGTVTLTLTPKDATADGVPVTLDLTVGPKGLMPADTNRIPPPDYLEDPNGNGNVDPGENAWDIGGPDDPDGDLISTELELILGTDPNQADNAYLRSDALEVYTKFE